jgi:hypothetical protein
MNTYKIDIDTKHTIWYRSTVKIEAESFEEAVSKAQGIYNEEVDWETLDVVENEAIEETLGSLAPDDNGGFATKEVYVDGDLMFSNSEK